MKQIQGEDELQTGLTAVRNWQFEINTYKIEKNINKIINNFILSLQPGSQWPTAWYRSGTPWLENSFS